jgi:uncharacterized membrane protein YphA (DoxX/SURF4 family)
MRPLPAPPPARGPVEIAQWALRFVIGGVLLYAGFSKAIGPQAEFAAAIEAYKLVPNTLLNPLAMIVPWIELAIGTYLVAGFAVRASAAAAAGLFSVFLFALISTLVRGIDLGSCGCFGAVLLSPKQTIGIDIILLLSSITVVRLKPQRSILSIDPP